MSENDYKVVPEFEEHCGGQIGAGDAPCSTVVKIVNVPMSDRIANLVEASKQRTETIFEFLGEGIVYQDKEGQIILCNDSAAEILGLTIDQMEGRTSIDPRWQSLKEDGSSFPGDQHPAMVALKTGERQNNILMNVLKPDGTRVWIKINSVPIFDNVSTKPVSVVTSFSDVSSIKFEEEKLRGILKDLQESQNQIEARRRGLEQANQELRSAADIDSETGLRNRRCFIERLCAEVSLASRKQIPLSILIGEIIGSEDEGEIGRTNHKSEMLAVVGDVLKSTCRISDFVARYGPDKFAVIMPHSTLIEASGFAERLLPGIESTNMNLRLKASIGIAEYRSGSLTNEFIESAEESLFRAKATGVGIGTSI